MRGLRRKKIEEDDDCLLLTEGAVASVREFGAVNWRGLWTLTAKETIRYIKIWQQTILSPLIMTFLFYAVFAIGGGVAAPQTISGVSFIQFLLPGLVMMSMAQSAFVSPAISLIISKLQGGIVDLLMPPLSAMEMTIAFTVSGVIRGLIVGVVSVEALVLVAGLTVPHIGIAILFAVLGSLMLSLMGLITGILGDKFDHLGAMQNFIIMPATFLSGTFFSVSQLPEEWRFVCFLNPFFYMIDGFRYAFTGQADALVVAGAGMLFIVSVVLFTIAYWLFAKGTRLKA